MNEARILPNWLAPTAAAGQMEAVSRLDAEWVLVHAIPFDVTEIGLRTVCINKSAIRALVLPFRALGFNAIYLHVSYPLDALQPRLRYLASYLQAPGIHRQIGYCDERCMFDSLVECTAIQTTLQVNRIVRSILSGTKQLKHYPISRSHLRHIIPTEVHDLLKRHPALTSRLSALNNIVEDWGDSLAEATFSTLAMYLLLLTDNDFQRIRGSILWTGHLPMVDWIKKAKEISVRLKSVQHTDGADYTRFFEMDVLLNRGVGAVDWKAEEENRTVNLSVTSHTYSEILQTARQLFAKAARTGKKPHKLDWDSFWQMRWEWATPGAVHSQHPEDWPYVPSDRDMKTKWHTLSNMPHVSLDYWLNRTPQTVAWPSVKYEWAKQRAIYGVDLTNYVLATFGYAGAEEVLPPECPLGTEVNQETIRLRVKAVTQNRSPFCIDFDDFNSQHSCSSMKAVLNAYLDVFAADLSQAQVAACYWIIAALDALHVNRVNQTGQYRALGTLLSGWRLTTFVNTVLNYCYIKIAVGDMDVPTLHSGDDVLAGVATYEQARALERALTSAGCRLQPTKCFLGGLCEFLRIDHHANSGGQYLSRATSTLVHAPTETRRPYMLSAIALALQTRWVELERRGADTSVLATVRQIQIRRIASKWDVGVALIEKFLTAHKCVGGASDAVEAPVDAYFKVIPIATQAVAANTSVAPGASAYAWQLCRELLTEEAFFTVRAQANRALNLVTGNTLYGITMQPVPSWIPDVRILRARYGCQRDVQGFSALKILAGLGLPIRSLRSQDSCAIEYYQQYPADHRIDWMAVTI